jgi:hypothetical protein
MPLHVIPGGVATDAVGKARAVNEARLAMDRWVDEGGRVPFEAAALLRVTRARREPDGLTGAVHCPTDGGSPLRAARRYQGSRLRRHAQRTSWAPSGAQ